MPARGWSRGGNRDWPLNRYGFPSVAMKKFWNWIVVMVAKHCECTTVYWMSIQYFTAVKSLPINAGDARDPGSIPGLGRSPGVGNGNPRQYSCPENSMDRGAWRAIVHGVRHEWATERKDTWKKNFKTGRYIKEMLTTVTMKRSLLAILH